MKRRTTKDHEIEKDINTCCVPLNQLIWTKYKINSLSWLWRRQSLICICYLSPSTSSHHLPLTPSLTPSSSSDPPTSVSSQLFGKGSSSLYRASHQSAFPTPYCSTSAMTPHPPSPSSLYFIFPCQVSYQCLSLSLFILLLTSSGQVVNMEHSAPQTQWALLCFSVWLLHLLHILFCHSYQDSSEGIVSSLLSFPFFSLL